MMAQQTRTEELPMDSMDLRELMDELYQYPDTSVSRVSKAYNGNNNENAKPCVAFNFPSRVVVIERGEMPHRFSVWHFSVCSVPSVVQTAFLYSLNPPSKPLEIDAERRQRGLFRDRLPIEDFVHGKDGNTRKGTRPGQRQHARNVRHRCNTSGILVSAWIRDSSSDSGALTVSTITTSARPPAAPASTPVVPAEERGVMCDVTWNLYDRLTDAIAERSSIRVAFDGKDVEIMVLGPAHENLGGLLSTFVDEVCDGLDVERYNLGSTTWKRPEVNRGVEADLSYCFDPSKVAACRAARHSNDGAAYPLPDLAAEIDISPPKIDRPGIYSALRVPEVWRFSGGVVSIEQLDAGGKYVATDVSQFLYVRAEEVAQWLLEARSAEWLSWKRRLREWARTVLRPRAGI